MKRFSPKYTKWIEIGLVIGAALIGLYALMTALPAGPGTPNAAEQPSGMAAEEDTDQTAAPSHITPEEMESFIASIGHTDPGQDPFLNSGEQEWKRFLDELRERPPRLKGIIQMKNSRVALIQDSRFREGDEVKGFRITKIEDKRVLLTKDGKIYTLSVAEQ